MKNFYFRDECDAEMCFHLDYHMDNARDEGLTEITLYEAVPEKVEGFFWCRAVDEVSEDGYCGKSCEDYEPKNGKSGMCRHKGNLFTRGEKRTFKVTGQRKCYCDAPIIRGISPTYCGLCGGDIED